MRPAGRLPPVSIEEYLAGELSSFVKHEYLGGVIYTMAGGRNAHNLIASNLLVALGARLRGKVCGAYNSDTKIRIRLPSEVRFYYPDASVICRSNPAADSFQDEPVLVAEVISLKTPCASTWRRSWLKYACEAMVTACRASSSASCESSSPAGRWRGALPASAAMAASARSWSPSPVRAADSAHRDRDPALRLGVEHQHSLPHAGGRRGLRRITRDFASLRARARTAYRRRSWSPARCAATANRPPRSAPWH